MRRPYNNWKECLRWLLAISVMGLILLPVSFLITLMAMPLWLWLESATGIESVGHSGPAQWCYFSVYMTLLILSGMLWLRSQH